MRPRVDGEQNEVAGILLKLDAASMVPIPSYELHLDDAVHALVLFFSVLSAGQARCILEKRILAHEYLTLARANPWNVSYEPSFSPTG
jgi:hypothetical protein